MNASDMKDCENQVLLFFRHLDEHEYDALAALLAPDALWYRQGKILQGPAQVLDALKQRSPTMKIAHVITNLAFVERGAKDDDIRDNDNRNDTDCTIRGYMLVVRHEPGGPLAGPAPLKGIESIRSVHVKLRKIEGQWTITEMSAEDNRFDAKIQGEEI